MPFTLSHPAAAFPVWPLVRRGYLPLAPFVVGALIPDFEYLLRLEPYALLSHSARGVMLFDLPVGLVALLVWWRLLEPFARALFALPPAATAAGSGAGWGGRQLLALVTGSVSHVTWDAFTHRDAWGPVLFPALKDTAVTVSGIALPWYNVAQAVSSVVGGGVVLWWLWREVTRNGEGARALVAPWRVRRWVSLGAAVVLAAVWNAPRHGMMSDPSRAKIVLGRAVVGGLVGLVVAMVSLALLYRAGRRDGRSNLQGEQHA